MALKGFLVVALIAAPAPAQEGEAPRKGSFQAVFKERHPSSNLKEVARRMGWSIADIHKQDPKIDDHKLESESFEVNVPEAYAPGGGFGLLIWISPMDSGDAPPEWAEVLAKRKLIVCGANNSGNERGLWYRVSLALDAVHNMSKRYTIDKNRIYVTGFSGGAKIAARLGIAFPDVFNGGIYQGAMNFYKPVPDPADSKKSFPAMFLPPAADLLKKARRECRHVVFVGAEDFNQPPSKATWEMMKKEPFERLHYMEPAETPHVWATAGQFAEALDFLDKPSKADSRK